MHLSVLTFSKITVKTTCLVDYETNNQVKLSYKFNLVTSKTSSNENLVNFTQWSFLIDECKVSFANRYCWNWQPEISYDICRLIGFNTVKCSPLHVKKKEERNFRFVGKFKDNLTVTSREQYSYRSSKCYCMKGFHFNPYLIITTDPISGRMLVRMKPYIEMSFLYLQSYIANVTNYSSRKSRIISSRAFWMENEGSYQFEITDLNVCSVYSVSVKLKTSDCINREMVPSFVKFNLSDTNISKFIESLSCSYNRTSVQIDGIDPEIDHSKFFFKVGTSTASFNVTENGTLSIFNVLLKENTLFSISMCTKQCDLCSQNYTLRCNSRIVLQSKRLLNKRDWRIVYIIVSSLAVILILVLVVIVYLYRKEKINVIRDYLNSRGRNSHYPGIVLPRPDESTETTSQIKPRNPFSEKDNIYMTIHESSCYDNDKINIQREEHSEELNRQLNAVPPSERQITNIDNVDVDFQLTLLASGGNNNGNSPSLFQSNTKI